MTETVKRYGSQSMAGTLRRVLMRRPGTSLVSADPATWHYGAGFDGARAVAQYGAFAETIAATGAEIVWIEDDGDGLADAMFTHDPSLVTEAGAVLLSMGKPLRRDEVALHEAAYRAAGVPILGRIAAPGTVEGGDCVWLGEKTLVVGRGVRSNEGGIAQLRAILAPVGIETMSFDLPFWQGEEACLHLMSVISPLGRDLALVHSPLLPAPFHQHLKARGITLVEGDGAEFSESFGLSLNVLPTAPRVVLAVEGYPKTKAAMEAAGCTVDVFAADALCVPCEGGPTCLTRPVWREGF